MFTGVFVESFVRPVRNPVLANLCQKLTRISQNDVVRAERHPFAGEHRNLKLVFTEMSGGRERFGSGDAIRKIGLEFEGTVHRGAMMLETLPEFIAIF